MTRALRALGPRSFAAAAAFGAIALLRFLPFASEPLDASLASWNASYTARYVQCWERAGFLALRGAPHLYISPTTPPEGLPYVHHPPLFPWAIWGATRVWGASEAGIRALPILTNALSCALLVLLGFRVFGAAAGVLAGILFLASPMAFFFGWMPSPESIVLCSMLIGVHAHESLRRAPLTRYAVVHCIFLAGLGFDWQMGFLVPALLAREVLADPGDRAWRRVLCLLPTAAVAFGGVMLLTLGWLGSFDAAWSELVGVALRSTRAAKTYTAAEWLGNQFLVWRDLFGWPVFAGAAVALPLAVRAAREGDAGAKILTALFVLGVANVVVFRGHSYDHVFWWYYALPFASLAPAWLAVRVLEDRLLLAGAALLAVGWGLACIHDRHAQWRTGAVKQLGDDWNRLAGADDALLFPFELGTESFYVKSWIHMPPRNREEFVSMLERAKRGELRVRRLVCVVPESICGVLDFTNYQAELPRFGTPERLDASAFRARAPALSALWCAPRVDLLVVGP